MARTVSKVTGLNGATAIAQELEILTRTKSGCAWVADSPREPTFGAKTAPSNADVVEYLRLGGRDITPNESDVNHTGQIIRDRVAAHMAKTGKTTPNGPVKPAPPPEKRALAGLASGLRKGAKYNADRMTRLCEAGSTNSGAPAERVTTAYGQRRLSKYGVNPQSVYFASGQLLNDLIRGKVKIYLANADVSGLL